MSSASSRPSDGTANPRYPSSPPVDRSFRRRDSKPSAQEGDQRRRSNDSNRSLDEDDLLDYVDEEQDDVQMRRTSSSSSRSNRRHSRSIPLSPPSVGSDDETHHQDEHAPIRSENILGNWHFAPLLVALVPPLGAVLGGGADAWSDAILLLIASFYLYQLLKGESAHCSPAC
jgi:hypothetical protein